ncbi:MAG: EAL domain-containing response regulator [Emcibacter sp.]|nr:EAL domain-containing response regulator [Emcibacter sp.]
MTGLKLLVVDDETDFAAFVAEVATDMDFKVQSTDNPKEFTLLYTADINIIVLDLFMPGIDGIELLRFLNKNKSRASIIFMSGKDQYVLQAARKLALEQGMTVLGILQKPFRADELENILNKYVPQSVPQSDNQNDQPSLDELRQAVGRQEMRLVYQPQINMANNKVMGFEALLRWHHPTKGEIPPNYFIPLAEKNGLISDLSDYVAKTAIQQLGTWTDHGYDFRISINFSPKILDDLDMPEKLAQCARDLNADISKIMIEVTETALMSDVAQYMDILARMRMKGFRLAIDDFGTGFSSLQQLVRAPFSELKIDQVFVRRMDTDKDCRTIVEISILLAHKMGMNVIAEGIENEAVWNILRDLGCDEGQGYWMSKPLSAEEIPLWLTKWSVE